MKVLELLAPARNKDIGIAAIDCGADAVYIGAREFGARKDAGNDLSDIGELCRYAHLYGARIFLTVNITLEDGDMDRVHDLMLKAQDEGVDAFIIRDPRIAGWKDIRVPLHASTQCAIRDVGRALDFESIGCGRIILERELSLDTIKSICSAVKCEVEFFVHGALCVSYSGECRLSEYLDGRSADKGECIQACRSLYDLIDEKGRILVHNKALLSLKDYNLKRRISDLADAGVCSFKIEGRLKNESYVRNVVRDYDLALQDLVRRHPDKYRRASFGRVSGGFRPNVDKTFNRSYTELFIDGNREGDKWSSMDAPKSMGEYIGKIREIAAAGRAGLRLTLDLYDKSTLLSNGDGFAYITGSGHIKGFRGDVCSGNSIICKDDPDLIAGMGLYRNIDLEFEKEIVSDKPLRELEACIDLKISRGSEGFILNASAQSEDGRTVSVELAPGDERARDRERALSMFASQLSKRSGIYRFQLRDIFTDRDELPFLNSASINSIRRTLSEKLQELPCKPIPLYRPQDQADTVEIAGHGKMEALTAESILMRSKYCIRYELGMCPVHQRAKDRGKLFLVNNGRRFALGFDCKSCEMTVSPASPAQN